MTRLDLLFFLGRPWGPIYGWIMQLRAFLFRTGLLPQHKLSAPVISVGNLVLGGSGKTPFVLYLAKMLQSRGFRPAIISRGYKGQATAAANIVSDGRVLLLQPEEAGDEPYMLAKSLPGVVVITGKKRILPARLAVEKFNVDVIILDDGFQHLSVARDLDIVLFDATVLAGNSRIFPAGLLREPVNALNRCDAFLITGQSLSNRERSEKFRILLESRWPETPAFSSHYNSWQLVTAEGTTALQDNRDSFFAFCGIANPERFQDSLSALSLNVAAFRAYDDHRSYTQAFVDKLEKTARRHGANKLVTTRKDFVKLEQRQRSMPVYVLSVDQHVPQEFEEFILKRITF